MNQRAFISCILKVKSINDKKYRILRRTAVWNQFIKRAKSEGCLSLLQGMILLRKWLQAETLLCFVSHCHLHYRGLHLTGSNFFSLEWMKLENYRGPQHEHYITRHDNRLHDVTSRISTEGKRDLALSYGRGSRELTVFSKWIPKNVSI